MRSSCTAGGSPPLEEEELLLELELDELLDEELELLDEELLELELLDDELLDEELELLELDDELELLDELLLELDDDEPPSPVHTGNWKLPLCVP
jgi:hypothetical protein